MNRNARIAAGLLAGAGITTTALGAAQAQADELVVRNTDASGNGSFAVALAAANHGRDADKIVFASHLSGAIDVHRDIEVEHPLRIVGNGDSSGASLHATGPADELEFGARGRSVLNHVGIEGLQVVNGNDFDSGALEIRNSTIVGAGEGVGAYLYGYGSASMSIERSTITGFELGVYAVKFADITIDRSNIVHNEGRGGVADTVYSSLEITDSTISGNTSRRYGGHGGGVRSGYESTIDLEGTAVVGNSARLGGGIYAYGDINVHDSTITGNHSDSGGADCAGANVISNGGNVFGDPTDCNA